MPVHDWTLVDAGTFHDFHNTWIVEIKNTMNRGRLPGGYYMMSEQHFGRPIADILTLQEPDAPPPASDGGVAVLAPPRTSRRIVASQRASYRAARKTLTIRHVSRHRIVALIEIVSPANKDRANNIERLVGKVHEALSFGVHVLLVDLFPPGPHDPAGLHGALWELYEDEAEPPPADQPLTLASYLGVTFPEADIEYVGVGQPMPDMPINLRLDLAVGVPLRDTYEAAFAAMPEFWRRAVGGD